MATLGQLKTRIRLETNRDDIAPGGEAEQALGDAIKSAIDYHATELFWFNRASGNVSTVGGSATIALPAGMLYAEDVSYLEDKLVKVGIEDIEHKNAEGVPSHWAEDEGAIYLHPIPDAAYVLKVTGIADIGVPLSDGDSNAWTTQAYDVIDARARIILYRDYWRDPEGAQIAAIAEKDALDRLRRHSRKRAGLRLLGPSDAPYLRSAFNIVTG